MVRFRGKGNNDLSEHDEFMVELVALFVTFLTASNCSVQQEKKE